MAGVVYCLILSEEVDVVYEVERFGINFLVLAKEDGVVYGVEGFGVNSLIMAE
jgi:hypothetical protein